MKLSAHSFAVFVYPFSFDRARFTDRVGAADRDSLAVGDQSWPIWARRSFPRDDLLRHVADYLNPPPGVPASACLWSLEERVLTSPNGLGLRVGALSLCLRHRCRVQDAAAAPVRVPEGALPLVVAGIDLALFGVGMGYLLFRVCPRSEAPEDWYDFLNGFRFIDRPGQVDLLFRRRTGKDRVEPFFPPLAAGADGVANGRGLTRHLVRGLLSRLAPEEPEWWRELFVPGQMLAYHALFFVNAPREEQPRVLYRLRNFFRMGQGLVPTADDLRPDHPALHPYADQMWFSVALEGGGFVAFDAPDTPFWSETMPAHLREQYLMLFLLALHQRFTLMHLSDQVSARWLADDDAWCEVRFADLREALLEFTARGYFHQVMQRDHHHRCFRAWQEVFETERLYQEVSDEVRELHGILLMRKTERIQRLAEEQRRLLDAQARADTEREGAAQKRAERIGNWLGGIAFLLGFPSLVLGFLEVVGASDLRIAVASLAGALLVGGALMLVVHLVQRQAPSRQADNPDAPRRNRDSPGG